MAAMIGGRQVPLQRVPSGVPGLDTLLYGGFLEGDAVLVAGAPGTGKSTLGMQYLYEGITRYDEPGFFITFEEFPQQIYRDALNFGWDFRSLEEADKLKVLFTSPDLMYQDIKRHEGIFPEMIREIGARRVVVDSITHFQRLAANAGELREIIYSLINALKREGLTPLLLRELMEGEALGTVAEEYTADTVLYLTMDRIEGQRMRFLEILKSRGSRHVPAKSLFFIQEEGLEVVPPFQEAFFRYQEAISVGVPDIDAMLGGGIPYGALYLFEISPELHQEIFELNFIRETLGADDLYIELSANTTRAEKLLEQAQSYGMRDELQTGLTNDLLRIVHVAEAEDALTLPESEPDEEEPLPAFYHALEELDNVFQQTSPAHRGRLLLDVTRLFSADEALFYETLALVPDLLQRYRGVCLAFLNPEAVPADACERLRSEADGIVRLWTEGGYKYIQVAKTVNSVLTPVSTVVETNSPPYLKILHY